MDLVIKNFTYTGVTDKAELISKVRFAPKYREVKKRDF